MKQSMWAYPNGWRGQSLTPDKDYWIYYVIEGVALMMLGIAAIIVPMFLSLVIEQFVGWLLLISGSFRVIALVRARHAPGFWWAAMTAALAVGLGLLLLIRPIIGILSLTIALTIMFAADGVASIFTALDFRKHMSNWGLLLASGVVNLARISHQLYGGLPMQAIVDNA